MVLPVSSQEYTILHSIDIEPPEPAPAKAMHAFDTIYLVDLYRKRTATAGKSIISMNNGLPDVVFLSSAIVCNAHHDICAQRMQYTAAAR